jgi:hypothetical protein
VRNAEAGRVEDPWREPPPVFASVSASAPESRADADALDI